MSYTAPTTRVTGEDITASDWNTDITNDVEYLFAATDPTSMLEVIWPVGGLYISTLSTNPATLLGFGTWAPFAAGRTLIGVGTSDQAFAAGATGGASSVTVQSQNLPSTSPWSLAGGDNLVSNSGGTGAMSPTGGGAGVDTPSLGTNGGGGNPLPTLPPYIVTYMWERTA